MFRNPRFDMDIYLIRHADAVPLGQNGAADDAERKLTELGHAQAQALGKALQDRGVHAATVVASPLVRARQTAEGLLGAWSRPTNELMVCPALAPGGKPRKLARYLEKLNAASVVLVGHRPDIETFAAWLIGSKKARIDLEKAGAALVRSEGEPGKGCGALVWVVTPAWCGVPEPAAV
jgi:phosphohistidine phosphatase